jgi:hypothetical protein
MMGLTLLAVILWLPNPYPAEMQIEPADAAPITVPIGAQLSELEMSNLIDHYFPDPLHDWALRVSKCESRWYTTAKNPRTSAAGLFQFKRSTWDWVADQTGTPSYDQGGVWEVNHQMVNAVWLVQNGGKQHWVCK